MRGKIISVYILEQTCYSALLKGESGPFSLVYDYVQNKTLCNYFWRECFFSSM